MEKKEIKDLLSLLEKMLDGDLIEKITITVKPKKKNKS